MPIAKDKQGAPLEAPEPTPPAKADEHIELPNIRIRRPDRPEGIREDRWDELVSLRLLLDAADRFLNTTSPQGGRSYAGIYSSNEHREILQKLLFLPGHALVRMHDAARDLAGHLRRDCPGIPLPEFPILPDVIPDGERTHVRLAVRDGVPGLRQWHRAVEAVVRKWAHENKPREKKRKKALEDRTDANSLRLVSLYTAIANARRNKEGPTRRAERLSHDKDICDLARHAGMTAGVTEDLVKKADQFRRDMTKRREERESQK